MKKSFALNRSFVWILALWAIFLKFWANQAPHVSKGSEPVLRLAKLRPQLTWDTCGESESWTSAVTASGHKCLLFWSRCMNHRPKLSQMCAMNLLQMCMWRISNWTLGSKTSSRMSMQNVTWNAWTNLWSQSCANFASTVDLWKSILTDWMKSHATCLQAPCLMYGNRWKHRTLPVQCHFHSFGGSGRVNTRIWSSGLIRHTHCVLFASDTSASSRNLATTSRHKLPSNSTTSDIWNHSSETGVSTGEQEHARVFDLLQKSVS